MNPLYGWEFKKNDLVRLGRGYDAPKVEFWKREGIGITNTQTGLERLKDYQIDIDQIKELHDSHKL